MSAPSTKQAPPLPLYLELGLVKGRHFVMKTTAKIPNDKTTRHPHKTLAPNVGSIRDYLMSNGYIITNTDKNVGTVVFKSSWLIEKSQDILNDMNNYTCLEHNEAIVILNEKCIAMEALAKHAAKYIDYLEGTVADFMQSKITLLGMTHHIPHFYGIPKIHKQPVKMHPIILCHSTI